MKSHLVENHKHKTDGANYDKSIGVMRNGEDNLYPTIVENLIDSSPTASQCRWVYSRFLSGGGFIVDLKNVDLSEGDLFNYTPNALLSDIAESISYHQGVFVHINYNAAFEKEDFSVMPYELCRLGKKDDKDYNGKIAFSKLGWGKGLKKDKIELFDVYNPNPSVISAQVEKAGGWSKYKGQILFFSFQNKRVYPKSLIDSVYLFADTENSIGLYFNGISRRGFNGNKIVAHKSFEEDKDKEKFYKDVEALMGIDNTSNVMMVEDDYVGDQQEGSFKIVDVQDNVKPEKYAHVEEASANYIRIAFKNIPTQLVNYISGKLGNSSGEDFKIAQSLYNNSIAEDRTKISQLFSVLFENYKANINPAKNWEIAQYRLLDDGTVASGKDPLNVS